MVNKNQAYNTIYQREKRLRERVLKIKSFISLINKLLCQIEKENKSKAK